VAAGRQCTVTVSQWRSGRPDAVHRFIPFDRNLGARPSMPRHISDRPSGRIDRGSAGLSPAVAVALASSVGPRPNSDCPSPHRPSPLATVGGLPFAAPPVIFLYRARPYIRPISHFHNSCESLSVSFPRTER